METFLDTEIMDKMDEIFNLQEKLNTRIGVNMNEMNDEDRAKWILNYIRAMQRACRTYRLSPLEMVG